MVANLFRHLVHGYAIGAGDMAFVGIVLPRAENQHTPGGYGVEQAVLRFVVITEAVVRDTDERPFLTSTIVEYDPPPPADKYH